MAESLPLYTILSNAQIAEIAQHRPLSLSSLNSIKSLGSARIEKYGERILALLQQFSASRQGIDADISLSE